jgi:hypothetical protein
MYLYKQEKKYLQGFFRFLKRERFATIRSRTFTASWLERSGSFRRSPFAALFHGRLRLFLRPDCHETFRSDQVRLASKNVFIKYKI